jgi:hypothetical protein
LRKLVKQTWKRGKNWVLIVGGGGGGGDELESGILVLMRYDVADSKKRPFSKVLCTASCGT